eukprot:4814696-Pleurochrysis_carterae.AAC.1
MKGLFKTGKNTLYIRCYAYRRKHTAKLPVHFWREVSLLTAVIIPHPDGGGRAPPPRARFGAA